MNEARRKKLKARKKKLKEQSEGNLMLYIKADETIRVRPLPVDENEEFGLEIIHFFLGAELKGCVSPMTFGLPCAIHEAYTKFKNSKDEDEKELAGKLKPKRKYVVPVIKFEDLKGKKVDEKAGVKLLQVTGGLYQSMVDYSLDSEHGDFTDPVEGYDLKFSRVGSTMTDTEYSVMNCKPTPLPKKYNKVWSTKELLTPELPTYAETKELLRKFLGEPEETVKKKKKKKKKPSAE